MEATKGFSKREKIVDFLRLGSGDTPVTLKSLTAMFETHPSFISTVLRDLEAEGWRVQRILKEKRAAYIIHSPEQLARIATEAVASTPEEPKVTTRRYRVGLFCSDAEWAAINKLSKLERESASVLARKMLLKLADDRGIPTPDDESW